MGTFLYTVVCRYYTIDGIIEIDLYEVLKRLRIDPSWSEYHVIHHHVYTGQAVEYVIKKVLRKVYLTKETSQYYSYYSPYSLMYDCKYDLKDVANMNNQSIFMRMSMSEKDFNKIYGPKKEEHDEKRKYNN